MSKKEIVKADVKDDAYSRILRYMQYPEDVVLTSKEEQILDRWIFCNVMLKDRKTRLEDIIEKISSKFSVSKFTARNDIGFTTALFVEARKISKEYLLYNHIEDIGLTIEKWKLDKSLAPFVPKLLHEYTIAVSKLPDQIQKREKPKVVNNFFVVQGQDLQAPMDYEDAFKEADKMIEADEKKPDPDYIDFEDQSNDPTNSPDK
jgi:hypothetical protein